MTGLWAENVAGYGKTALASQATARGILEKNGVKIHDPSARDLATTRTAMIDAIAPLIKDAKLSDEVVRLVKEAVGASA